MLIIEQYYTTNSNSATVYLKEQLNYIFFSVCIRKTVLKLDYFMFSFYKRNLLITYINSLDKNNLFSLCYISTEPPKLYKYVNNI